MEEKILGRGMHRRLEPNSVSLSKSTIILGSKVSNFFKIRNITHASIIIDYKNKSIILWGEKDTGEKKFNAGILGYRILYPKKYLNSKNKSTMIKFRLGNYINVLSHSLYLAKPLNNHSVIIENVSLQKINLVQMRVVIDIDERFMIFGNLDIIRDLKPSDLIRKSSNSLITKNENEKLPIVNKEYDINDVQKIPAGNSLHLQAIEQADREYSRMILGE